MRDNAVSVGNGPTVWYKNISSIVGHVMAYVQWTMTIV